jgi:hypothetical protein
MLNIRAEGVDVDLFHKAYKHKDESENARKYREYFNKHNLSSYDLFNYFNKSTLTDIIGTDVSIEILAQCGGTPYYVMMYSDSFYYNNGDNENAECIFKIKPTYYSFRFRNQHMLEEIDYFTIQDKILYKSNDLDYDLTMEKYFGVEDEFAGDTMSTIPIDDTNDTEPSISVADDSTNDYDYIPLTASESKEDLYNDIEKSIDTAMAGIKEEKSKDNIKLEPKEISKTLPKKKDDNDLTKLDIKFDIDNFQNESKIELSYKSYTNESTNGIICQVLDYLIEQERLNHHDNPTINKTDFINQYKLYNNGVSMSRNRVDQLFKDFITVGFISGEYETDRKTKIKSYPLNITFNGEKIVTKSVDAGIYLSQILKYDIYSIIDTNSDNNLEPGNLNLYVSEENNTENITEKEDDKNEAGVSDN